MTFLEFKNEVLAGIVKIQSQNLEPDYIVVGYNEWRSVISDSKLDFIDVPPHNHETDQDEFMGLPVYKVKQSVLKVAPKCP